MSFRPAASPWGGRPRVLAMLLVIAVLSSAIAIQGWKERLPNTDDFLPILDAYSLVRHGAIPERGTLSSFMSYIPPGTTWFWALGAAVTTDPRTVELYGAVLLNIAAIVAIFLLARNVFSHAWIGVAAAATYAFSPLGQRFAISLWPRGHPFFSSAVALCVVLWVRKRQPWYLTAAIVLLASGCYYFLELAPLGIILVVAAVVFRPPLSLVSVVAGLALSLAVWTPYLRWDAGQGFRNTIAAVERKSLVSPTDSRIAWCNAKTSFVSIDATGRAEPFRFIPADYYPEQEKIPNSRFLRLAKRLAKDFLVKGVEGFLANFTEGIFLPFVGALFAGLVIGSVWFSIGSLVRRQAAAGMPRFYRGFVLSWCVLAIVLLVVTYSVARHNPSLAGSALATLLGSSALVIAAGTGALIRQIVPALKAIGPAVPWYRTCGACAAPALVAIVIAERGHTNRLWWLWPLEIVLLLAVVADLREKKPRWALALSLFIVAAMAANSSIGGRIGDLYSNGFAGKENALATLLNRAAGLAGANKEIAVGYQYPFERWEPVYSAVDARYRAGMEADLYLRLRHGVMNTDRCAEGFSDADEFRIVETAPRNPTGVDAIMAVSSLGGYRQVACDGSLCLFQRL